MAGNVSLEDGSEQQSERCGSYDISTDVRESESCSSFSCRRFNAEMMPVIGRKDTMVWEEKLQKCEPDLSEVEMMKERFAKLLLGEDMSGGGNGVSFAFAISNAITNLSATVFGELWRLEPLAPQKKSMWCREME